METLALRDLLLGVLLRCLNGGGDLVDLLFGGGLLDLLTRGGNGDRRLIERDRDRV